MVPPDVVPTRHSVWSMIAFRGWAALSFHLTLCQKYTSFQSVWAPPCAVDQIHPTPHPTVVGMAVLLSHGSDRRSKIYVDLAAGRPARLEPSSTRRCPPHECDSIRAIAAPDS